MSFIARQFVFIPGEPILAEEWTAELDQLYSFLSGSKAGQILLKQNSLNPVLIVQNSSVGGLVAEFQQGNSPKIKILSNQQLQSLITGVPPFNVASTTKVVGLNAQYLDGFESISFLLVNTVHTEYFIPFYFDSGLVTTTKIFSYIVPAGTNMSVIQVKATGTEIILDPIGEITISLRKNGANIQTINLTPGNNWQQTNVLATNVVENDVLSCIITAVVAPGIERAIVRIKFKQDLNT